MALIANGGQMSLTGVTLTKSGDDTDADADNFYGVNSILLAVGDGSTATVSGSKLSATSSGSNGIFSTDAATVLANDVSISTISDNSRRLDATYGGTILGANLSISTEGDHSAGIATDRGGGSILGVDSTLATQGSGSPLLYSTGDIELNNVSGTASGSQIAGMEGLNTILINNSTLESTNTGTTGSMFYLTNTTADIVLSNTTLDFDADAANLLTATGNDSNSWGTAGSNGAMVKFTLLGEDVSGDISADTISQVTAYLADVTTWTGAAQITENSAGSTVDAPVNINVDDTSTWVVTEDSTVSNLTVAAGGQVADADGNAVAIVAGGQTVVEGTSDITVTVEGSYSTSYDNSEEGSLSQALIDRSDFDEAFGTSTSYTMGDTASDSGITTAASASTNDGTDAGSSTDTQTATNPIAAFFEVIGRWFAGLFS